MGGRAFPVVLELCEAVAPLCVVCLGVSVATATFPIWEFHFSRFDSFLSGRVADGARANGAVWPSTEKPERGRCKPTVLSPVGDERCLRVEVFSLAAAVRILGLFRTSHLLPENRLARWPRRRRDCVPPAAAAAARPQRLSTT